MKTKIFATLIIIFCLGFFFFQIGLVSASTAAKQFNQGLVTTGVGAGYTQTNPQEARDSLPLLIGNIIGAVLMFVGVIFLLLMIYGGYIWMMARGNEQEVTKAKNIITNSIIGLVITLAAYAITTIISDVFFAKEA